MSKDFILCLYPYETSNALRYWVLARAQPKLQYPPSTDLHWNASPPDLPNWGPRSICHHWGPHHRRQRPNKLPHRPCHVTKPFGQSTGRFSERAKTEVRYWTLAKSDTVTSSSAVATPIAESAPRTWAHVSHSSLIPQCQPNTEPLILLAGWSWSTSTPNPRRL